MSLGNEFSEGICAEDGLEAQACVIGESRGCDGPNRQGTVLSPSDNPEWR